MGKIEFIIENQKFNDIEYQVLKIKINDKIYYLGTLKEYKDFCYIQTKSKRRLDK